MHVRCAVIEFVGEPCSAVPEGSISENIVNRKLQFTTALFSV